MSHRISNIAELTLAQIDALIACLPGDASALDLSVNRATTRVLGKLQHLLQQSPNQVNELILTINSLGKLKTEQLAAFLAHIPPGIGKLNLNTIWSALTYKRNLWADDDKPGADLEISLNAIPHSVATLVLSADDLARYYRHNIDAAFDFLTSLNKNIEIIQKRHDSPRLRNFTTKLMQQLNRESTTHPATAFSFFAQKNPSSLNDPNLTSVLDQYFTTCTLRQS